MNVILGLIAQGKIREALDMLLESSKDDNPDVHEQALMLSARFENYRKEKRIGLLDSDLELRKVEHGIIQLANQIKNSPKQKAQKKHLILFLVGCIFTLAIIFPYLSALLSSKKPIQTESVADTSTYIPSALQNKIIRKDVSTSSKGNTEYLQNENTNTLLNDTILNKSIDYTSNKIKTSNDSVQLLSPKTNTPIAPAIQNTPDYIEFNLIFNYTEENFLIFIDGQLAEIVDNSSPLVKVIRLDKSSKVRKIEIIYNGVLLCAQNLVITNNQKISMSCVK